MKSKSLLQVIGAVAVINLLSRMVGFFREAVIGYQFGTSYAADSVVAAYTLPNFFYVVIGGAVTTAFISIYSKFDDPLRCKEYTERIFGWLSIGLVLFTAMLLLFSEQVIALLFSGLAPEEYQLTVDLFRIMAPSTLFLIISMWFTGVMNVNNRFSWTAFATLLLNGSFLLIAVVLYPWLGAFAHAWGALFSAALMAIFLIFMIRRGRFISFRPKLGHSPETWRTMKMAVPIMLGGATLQLYFLIHRMFGSWLEEGYISALNYTSKIVQLPQSVLMMAVTTVVYPLLAAKVGSGKKEEITSLYFRGLRYMALTILPVSIFVMLYAADIIRAVFQYGSFDAQSTAMVSPLLQILVIGMFFHAANLYITRFYYAYERTFFPVVMSLIAVLGINVGINFALVERFGAEGLAWGTSISAVCNFCMLLVGSHFMLNLQKDGKNDKASGLPRLLLLLILFGAGLFSFRMVFTVGGPYISLAAGGTAALILMLVLMKFLHIEEIDGFIEKVKKKVVKQ
ncbi:murein biosynthesis integral membrane protein MurJ [Alteribacillus sp. HJP-4]|uniref:murein biosynthesis integral membrane protein MurJ n=1 Tax=Alteribacillus sp. HJP-4 TaxID=2775394 RepID=UPI0035CD1619